MSLKLYIDQQNLRNSWFKKPAIDIKNISAAQKKDLLEQLECDLSPENLTCDGEIRGAKLLAKSRMLRAAQAELQALVV